MADELKLTIDLDTKSVEQGFKKVEQASDSTSKKIAGNLDNSTDSFSDELGALTKGFGIAAAGVAALGVAVKKTFDFALLGEATKAVETRFNALANSAGVAAEQLKVGVIEATQGLLDDEDALQIATKGIVAFGKEAERLPQVLDLARSASRGLGLDLKDSFESLSTFVQTGSERVLRQFGIVVDLEKAYAAAAKSIGLTTAELTEQQKQTVRLNVLLGETADKFNSVSESATPLKDNIDRLRVSIGNLAEESAISFNDKFGPALNNIITGLTNLIQQGPSLGQIAAGLLAPGESLIRLAQGTVDSALSAEQLKNKIADATTEVSKLEDQLISLKEVQGNDPFANVLIDKTNTKLLEAKENLKQYFQLLSQRSTSGEEGILPTQQGPSNQVQIKATDEQIAARQAKETGLTQFLLQEELKRVQQSIQLKQTEISQTSALDAELKASQDIQKLNEVAAQVQQQLTIAAIKKQFVGTDATIEAERGAALASAAQTNEAILTGIKAKGEADRVAIKKKFAAQELAATSTALGQIATLQESSIAELASIGKAAAITKATIDGYLAVQNAFATVPYPFNFAAAALVGVAAAANVAKIAGVGGEAGSSAFNPSTGGGGIAASPSPTTEITPPAQLERQAEQTAVQLIVQGDIFDSDNTATRLTDLLNDAFDKKGVVIQRGAFA